MTANEQSEQNTSVTTSIGEVAGEVEQMNAMARRLTERNLFTPELIEQYERLGELVRWEINEIDRLSCTYGDNANVTLSARAHLRSLSVKRSAYRMVLNARNWK